MFILKKTLNDIGFLKGAVTISEKDLSQSEMDVIAFTRYQNKNETKS